MGDMVEGNNKEEGNIAAALSFNLHMRAVWQIILRYAGELL